jgi:hypothetical protein
MKSALSYLVARAKERSTWMGAITLASAAGLAMSPEQATAIATAGASLASLVGIFTKG